MPLLCENRLFKTAFCKTIEAQTDAKRLLADSRHNRKYKRKWWTATAKYYEPKLEQVDRALKAIYQNGNFRIKSRQKRLSTRTRRALLGHLAEALDWYAWQYHEQVQGSDILPNPKKADLYELYRGAHANTMAARALNTIPTQFIAYISEVITHVHHDWDAINAVFFPDWELIGLEDVIPTHSKTYKGGKCVVILVFKGCGIHSNQTEELRLVYKPSDLYLHYQIVGDTERVRAALKASSGSRIPSELKKTISLFETINTLIEHREWVPDTAFSDKKRPHPRLPVYPILPKNSGQVEKAYGYLQYLSHTPEARKDISDLRSTLLLSEWDWVTGRKDDLIDYYRILGWYAFIALTFGMIDIHFENLIVSRKKPYLIDIEMAFKGDVQKIEATGLSYIIDMNASSEGSSCHLFYKKSCTYHPTAGERAAYWVTHAMNEAAHLLATDPGNAVWNWLHSTALAKTIARYLPEPIEAYVVKRQGIYEGGNSLRSAPSPGGRTKDFLANDRFSYMQRIRIREWYNGEEPDLLPHYTMSAPKHDWYDYLCCDIPVYYQQLSGMDLLNARGKIVRIAAPSLAWNDPKINAKQDRPISGSHYFDHVPGVYLFQANLTDVGIPADNPVYLDEHLIKALEDSFKRSNHKLTYAARATTERPGSHWRINDGKRIYHIRLPKATNLVKVYKVGPTIEVIQAKYRLFREDRVLRSRLIHQAQQDVRSYYAANVKNTRDGVSIFNDF